MFGCEAVWNGVKPQGRLLNRWVGHGAASGVSYALAIQVRILGPPLILYTVVACTSWRKSQLGSTVRSIGVTAAQHPLKVLEKGSIPSWTT